MLARCRSILIIVITLWPYCLVSNSNNFDNYVLILIKEHYQEWISENNADNYILLVIRLHDTKSASEKATVLKNHKNNRDIQPTTSLKLSSDDAPIEIASEKKDTQLASKKAEELQADNSDNQRISSVESNKSSIAFEMMPAYKNQSIDSVLGENTWVQLSSSSTPNSQLKIRGQRATVLYNGIALNQFNSQAQNIALIPDNSINDINIKPSASSVLYGSMGIGGVIDIAQKFSDCNQYSIGSDLNYPTGGGVNFFVNQLLNKGKTSQLQLSGKMATTENYRDYSRNFNNAFNMGWLYQSEARELSLSFSDSYQYLQFPGSLSQSEVDEDPWQSGNKQKHINHVINTQAVFKQVIDNWWQVKIQSQYQQQWARNISQNYSSTQTSSMLYFRPSIGYQDSQRENILGAEFNYQTFTNSAIIPNSNQLNLAVFDQLALSLNQQWKIGGGGRFENSNTSGTFIDLKNSNRQILNVTAANIYLQYLWSDALSSKFSISHAYQLPFIDQSNYTPNITSQFGLDPETAWIYQLDSCYHNAIFEIHSSLYWMAINDQIDYADNGSAGFNINLPRTRTIGSLLSFDYQIYPSFLLGSTAALNYNTFVSDSSKYLQNQVVSGKQVPGSPLFTAEGHIKINLTQNLTLWLQEKYTSSMYANGDFMNTLGRQSGYFLTNMRLSYERMSWQFTFSVDNLFNQFYYNYVITNNANKFYYPGNGISVMFNVQYRLTGQ